MPTLPSAAQIQRRGPQLQTGVSRVDTSQVGQGARALAGATQDVQAAREYVGQYEANKAETQFLIHLTEKASSFEDDPDFNTYDERFSEAAKTTMGELASSISSPAARNQFVQRAELQLAQNRARVQDLARTRWRDSEQASFEETAAALRDQAIRTGNVTEGAAAITDQIMSGAEIGIWSREEAELRSQEVRRDWATAYIESLPVTERLDAVSEVTDLLPEDVRVRLERETREEMMQGQAMSVVDELLSSGMTAENVDFSMIENPELRDTVERRFYTEYNRMRSIEADRDARAYNDVYQTIVFGSGAPSVDELQADGRLENMTPQQIEGLRQAEAFRVAGNTITTPRGVYDQISLDITQGRFTDARENLTKAAQAGQVSNSDYRSFSSIIMEGDALSEAPVEVESLWTATQSLTDIARNAGINKDETHQQLRQQLDDWYRRYQQINNRVPDEDQVTKQIQALVTKVTIERPRSPVVSAIDTVSRAVTFAGIPSMGSRTTTTVSELQRGNPGLQQYSPVQIQNALTSIVGDLNREPSAAEVLEYLQAAELLRGQ